MLHFNIHVCYILLMYFHKIIIYFHVGSVGKLNIYGLYSQFMPLLATAALTRMGKFGFRQIACTCGILRGDIIHNQGLHLPQDCWLMWRPQSQIPNEDNLKQTQTSHLSQHVGFEGAILAPRSSTDTLLIDLHPKAECIFAPFGAVNTYK